jgi:hypothetical protein
LFPYIKKNKSSHFPHIWGRRLFLFFYFDVDRFFYKMKFKKEGQKASPFWQTQPPPHLTFISLFIIVFYTDKTLYQIKGNYSKFLFCSLMNLLFV